MTNSIHAWLTKDYRLAGMIHVGRNKVDIIKCMRYLGQTVTNDINDSLVKPVINDFMKKVNTCLAYFNDVVI